MTGPGTRLVVYRADRRYVGFLKQLNQPEHGIVAVRIRPGMRRESWLYRDILAAVGKLPSVTGTTSLTELTDITTAAWLRAHHITQLVVLDAGNASRQVLAHMQQFADAMEIGLWICAERHITQAIADTVIGRQVDVVDQRSFDRTFALYMNRRPVPRDHAADYPAVIPFSSYPVFIEDVERLLTPDDAHHVRTLHALTYAHFSRQLAGVPTDDQVRRLAHEAVHTASTIAKIITTVRAFQQAAFDAASIHVSFHERRLAGDWAILGRHTALDPETWVRLRAYRQPYRGAAAAIQAAGIPIDGMHDLQLGDVGEATVTCGGQLHALHPGSELFVRALAWERNLSGAASSDRLFVAPSGAPYPERRLADAITVLRTEIGVNLYGHDLGRRNPTVDQFANKYIHSITRLRETA